MEQRSWSPVATHHGIDKKRHISLDREDTNRGSKRVCVEPVWGPMGFDSSSNLDNSWEAEPSTIHPYFQLPDTASELINSLEAHSPSRFTTEQSIHDSAHLLSNHGQVFGASHSAAGCALPSIASLPFVFPDTGCTLLSIANLPFRFLDTRLSRQTLDLGPSIPAVTNTSQYDDNEYLSFPLNTHDNQIQQANDLGHGWGTDLSDSNTDLWANPAASLSHHPNSSPQETFQYLTPVQSQSTDMVCFPANVGESTAGVDIKTEVSTEWSYMENTVHLVESESIIKAETESRPHTPNASESSITSLDSGESGKPKKLHGVSSPSYNLLKELNACDKVSDLEPIIELPHVPQYDACFGVVSHPRLTCD